MGGETTTCFFPKSLRGRRKNRELYKNASNFHLNSLQICFPFPFPATMTYLACATFCVIITEVLGKFQNSWAVITSSNTEKNICILVTEKKCFDISNETLLLKLLLLFFFFQCNSAWNTSMSFLLFPCVGIKKINSKIEGNLEITLLFLRISNNHTFMFHLISLLPDVFMLNWDIMTTLF